VSLKAGLETPFYWPIRVYYEDTDAGGVVYYANYLKFFERARTEWLRSLGFEQDVLRDEHGVIFVVSSVQIEYKRVIKFNEELRVSCMLTELSAATMNFHQVAERTFDGAVLSEATVRIVCVNAQNFKPKPIPNVLRSCCL